MIFKFAGRYECPVDGLDIAIPTRLAAQLDRVNLYLLDRGDTEFLYVLPEDYYKAHQDDLTLSPEGMPSPLSPDFSIGALLERYHYIRSVGDVVLTQDDIDTFLAAVTEEPGDEDKEDK